MRGFESAAQKYEPEKVPEEIPRDPNTELTKTQEAAKEVLAALDSLEGFRRISDPTAILSALPAEHFIVRRENPDRIIDLAEKQQPIEISFEGESPYANSVDWNPGIDGVRGLDNAYLEGYGHKHNVITIFGFKKPENFYFEHLDASQRVFSGVDRTRVRAAAGQVPLDAVEFVIVRIPITAVQENNLTENESDALFEYQTSPTRKPAFVYRTYVREGK